MRKRISCVFVVYPWIVVMQIHGWTSPPLALRQRLVTCSWRRDNHNCCLCICSVPSSVKSLKRDKYLWWWPQTPMLRRLFRTSVALRKCDKNCSVLVKCSEISNLQLIIDQHYSIYRSLQYHWEFYSLHRDGAVLPPEATITCGPLDSQSLRVIPQLVHVSYPVRYFVPNI